MNGRSSSWSFRPLHGGEAGCKRRRTDRHGDFEHDDRKRDPGDAGPQGRPQLGPTAPEARETFLARVSDDAMRELLALALAGKTEPEILAAAPLDLMQAVARAYAEDLTTDEVTAGRVFRLAHEELDRAWLKRELARLDAELRNASEADRPQILAEIGRRKAERQSLREQQVRQH